MVINIGPAVLGRKSKVSLDSNFHKRHNVLGNEDFEMIDFKKAFLRRTKEARIHARLTQEEIAEALGIPQDHYKQYERRTQLPQKHIYRFCLVCGVDLIWFMSGHGSIVEKRWRGPQMAPKLDRIVS